jgi:hypothetical protein
MIRFPSSSPVPFCLLFACLSSITFADQGAPTQLYWGDTHLHTKYSSDAFLNSNFSVGPDEAYRFAKGEGMPHPSGDGSLVSIAKPLDFLVVSDHAEGLGVVNGVYFQEDAGDLGLWAWLRRKLGHFIFSHIIDSGDGPETFANIIPPITRVVRGDPVADPDNVQASGGILGDTSDIEKNVWQHIIAAADRHYQPGKFTTFIGWEWSSLPMGANLHRVIFTPDNAELAKKYHPYSSNDSQYPEDLWRWLDKTASEVGAEFLAIPHNSNLSKGYMFAETSLKGDKITPDYARLRARYESVVEITQTKGDSETWPDLSPNDPFADFERYPHYLLTTSDVPYRPTKADFVRQTLGTGMKLETEIGINPFKLGGIGSTDSHTGYPSSSSDNFLGKFSYDSLPENKAKVGGLPTNGWDVSASGIAAVWATENTRQGIFNAFKRREVYASTGPRISLRVFGGFDFPADMAESENFAEQGYRAGVPMGGDLFGDTQQRPLSLAIRATRDPRTANLDQVHVVKIWLDEHANSHEQVYPVAWSDERPLADNGFPTPVGNTVDLATGKVDHTIGSPELSTVWTDPDFKPAQKAAYYVRVIQIPTARHSLYSTNALGLPVTASGQPVTIQERAYSSAIWYTPAPQ